MDPGDLIAGYAAVVATVALGWQILKERRARRPQVEVKISYSLLGYPDREAAGAAHIEARNRGDMPVRVTSAGFELQDDSEKVAHITHQPPGATLPGVIGPRDSGFIYLLEDALGPLDPFGTPSFMRPSPSPMPGAQSSWRRSLTPSSKPTSAESRTSCGSPPGARGTCRSATCIQTW
jgi:hypothetical protein